MKQKILYILITAVIGVAAFFGGKNFSDQPTQPETKAPKLQMERTFILTGYQRKNLWKNKEEKRMNKEYRIDTFVIGKEHNSTFFDTKEEALIFAGKEVARGKHVYLLEHVLDGVYNVVEEIR